MGMAYLPVSVILKYPVFARFFDTLDSNTLQIIIFKSEYKSKTKL